MRVIGLQLSVAMMVVATACSGDRVLSPTSGHAGQLSDIPPELFAAYTRASLPGTETVVALNDSGDVVGATATGGVLWHGTAHERTTLPIIPTAIANDGTVAGSIDGHAATWKNGQVTVLDTATSETRAICRCDAATVVGSVEVNGVTHAAIWVDGNRIDAGLPPNSQFAEFSSITNGFIVGTAFVRGPDPHSPGDSTNFLEPFSWSPASGWHAFQLTTVDEASISSVNVHGIAVGFGVGVNEHNVTKGVIFDVAAGTGEGELPSNPLLNDITPTGINDSGLMSASAQFLDPNGSSGFLALVSSSAADGLVLPPGDFGDNAVGINSAGIIGGQSNGLPVLWVPNP